MAASFRIDITGGRAIEATLSALVEAFSDPSPIMDVLGAMMESQTRQRFSEETAPDGSRWKPSIRARLEGRKTLTGSGAILRDSITHVASGTSVEVGTNKVYAGIHQFGGEIHAKTDKGLRFRLPGNLGFRTLEHITMPARPFLGLSSDDEDELIDQVEQFLAERMG